MEAFVECILYLEIEIEIESFKMSNGRCTAEF